HRKAVRAVAAAPVGPLVASAGADGRLLVWDAGVTPGGEPLQTSLRPAGPFAFAPDGKTLAVVDQDHSVKLLDSAAGTIRTILRGHGSAVHAVAFTPDGRTIAAAGEDTTVRLWQAGSGQESAL